MRTERSPNREEAVLRTKQVTPCSTRTQERHGSTATTLAAVARRVSATDRWATPSVLVGEGRVGDIYGSDFSVSAARLPLGHGRRIGYFNGRDGLFADLRAVAAELYGADDALISLHGSSGGNQVIARYLAMTATSPVLLSRNCHHSLLDALVHEGVHFYFIPADYVAEFEAFNPPTPAQIEGALRVHGDARAVLLTSPTYEGVAAPLSAISATVRTRTPDCLLVVDAAWAAHYPFHSDLPDSPLTCGADLAVVSSHKLGGALQPAALVLWNADRIESEHMACAHAELTTTSPSPMIIASLESSLKELSLRGAAHVGRCITLAHRVRHRIRAELPEIAVFDGCGHLIDPTKVTLGLSSLSMSGYAARDALLERAIVAEKCGYRSITFIATFQLRSAAADRLVDALHALRAEPTTPLNPLIRDPFAHLDDSPIIEPRLARRLGLAAGYRVPLETAADHVAAQRVELYPPGIPAIIPGFRITRESLLMLSAAPLAGGDIATAGNWSGTVLIVPPDQVARFRRAA
jgi:arginine decarboxylase